MDIKPLVGDYSYLTPKQQENLKDLLYKYPTLFQSLIKRGLGELKLASIDLIDPGAVLFASTR